MRGLPEGIRHALRCVPDLSHMRAWRSLPIDELTRAERVMLFIEHYIPVPEGKFVGELLHLEPFQEAFIYAIYDNPSGTSRAYLSIARKNGKTATIAAILMAHLVGPEAQRNSQIVSGALSRDQAAIVFALASKMIGLNEDLQSRCGIVPSSKKIFGYAAGTEYKALSADAPTAHGLSPVLAILDEIGQIRGPRSAFVDAIETAQGAHDEPLLIAISTSAPSDADLFSVWCDDAERDPEPDTVSIVFESEKDCRLDDREQWVRSNPALSIFRNERNLAKLMRNAPRQPSSEASARNLLLNQRVALEGLWLAPGDWRPNGESPDMGVFALESTTRDGDTALGLDLSARQDLTSAVLAAKDLEGRVHVLPFVFTPVRGLEERAERDRAPYDQWVREGFLIAIPGASVNYKIVAGWLSSYFGERNLSVGSIEFDRWRIKDFRQACEGENDEDETSFGPDRDDDERWRPVGQGFRDMGPRCDAFEECYVNHRLRHGMHPLLTMAASNAILTEDPAGGKKLDKTKASQRIDPLVAAVMAVYAVTEGLKAEDTSSQFDDESRDVIM